MTRRNDAIVPDPFGERSATVTREEMQLLGGRFQFESNSPELLRLVDLAYAGLPGTVCRGRRRDCESDCC